MLKYLKNSQNVPKSGIFTKMAYALICIFSHSRIYFLVEHIIDDAQLILNTACIASPESNLEFK